MAGSPTDDRLSAQCGAVALEWAASILAARRSLDAVVLRCVELDRGGGLRTCAPSKCWQGHGRQHCTDTREGERQHERGEEDDTDRGDDGEEEPQRPRAAVGVGARMPLGHAEASSLSSTT